jgi:peroxiredoxin
MRPLIIRYFLLFFLFPITFLLNAQQPTSGYKPGDLARDFSLKSTNGKMVSLASYTDAKGIIVVFTCNHCPFAKAYEQRIIALHNKCSPLGYPVVAINPNDPVREPEDSYENMQLRAKEMNYPFAYLIDETQEIAKTYGASRTPHVFLLKKTKKGFRVMSIGAIDDNSEDEAAVQQKYVEQSVKELNEGKPISNPFTRAIGCSIKWRKG